uniref:Hpt domain-containing protein n=1 Tax=Dyella ginsengisoli TaxID=363848 RepID=UPI00047590CD
MDPSFDAELRDDFLVEAGELVERLGEQLVDLESTPQDAELLNAVFRAFHTVKGGAGFLSVEPMVQLCHHAEDLLNAARNGALLIDPPRMDALLEALDLLQAMMAALAAGQSMDMPPADLLARLTPGTAKPAPAPTPKPVAPPPQAGDGTIDDSEFEALLDSLYGTAAPGAVTPEPVAAAPSGSIGDDEFEALLDQLHGGAVPGGQPPAAAAAPATASGAINDDEFEALLDS